MENNLVINKKILKQTLIAQGLKTPGIIDILIDDEDINLETLEIRVVAIIDNKLSNVIWVALELQKLLHLKVCSLIDNNNAKVNIQIVLKEDDQNE